MRSAHLDMLPGFGERLCQLLAMHKMSRRQAAKALSISPRHVLELEQGELVPSYKVLLAIADLFGVMTDFLLGCGEVSSVDRQTAASAPVVESLGQMRDKLAQGRITYEGGKPLDERDHDLLLGQLDLLQRARQVKKDQG